MMDNDPLFYPGKLYSSSPFKVIYHPSKAVQPIDQGRPTTHGKDTGPTACPTLAAMFGVTDLLSHNG